MRCPKCQFDHPLQTTECLKCGIVFARYQEALERAAKPAASTLPMAVAEPLVASAVTSDRIDGVRELWYRALALPMALLVAWLINGTGLRMASAMLAMVLHESGHAITAWLTGRWAIPLLWVTLHGEERSWVIVLVLTATIVSAGLWMWRAEQWGWVLAAIAVLILQVIFLNLPAGAAIVFCGEGGAMVLATLLMAMFYAPRESALCKSWGLRWGLLVIGALSFMHVFRVWTGPFENIPFGEIEGVGPSDPTLLTEMYGWSVTQVVDRYVRVGTVCLVFLGGMYVWGLVSAYLQMSRSSDSSDLENR
ncbi:MAG TPA: hypothetical protein VMU53_12260 [Candidatus Sulfotelmatobacter sp.]|nr:hypothetical protein [Candidatus Sulfotelmatobacter sp.]